MTITPVTMIIIITTITRILTISINVHNDCNFIMLIGGSFIVRSNWRVYCEELETSIRAISESSVLPGLTTVQHFRTISNTGNGQVDSNLVPEKVTTHFEKKYLQVGLDVFESRTDLGFRNREDRCSMLNSIVAK